MKFNLFHKIFSAFMVTILATIVVLTLIVEDESKIAELLRDYLVAAGFISTIVERGDLAVEEVRKGAPALVLLDIMLPGMDGMEVCREIRKFSTIPIIMLTARNEHQISRADQVTVVFVGSLIREKGPQDLIQAIKDPSLNNIRLVIVGDGILRQELVKECERAVLTERVEWQGTRSQDEVAAILSSGDILCLPSYTEGKPNVIKEAMASGLPVIATRVGGVGELVTDGITGQLFSPGNVRELRECLKKLAADTNLRVKMGKAGLEKIRFFEPTLSMAVSCLFAACFFLCIFPPFLRYTGRVLLRPLKEAMSSWHVLSRDRKLLFKMPRLKTSMLVCASQLNAQY